MNQIENQKNEEFKNEKLNKKSDEESDEVIEINDLEELKSLISSDTIHLKQLIGTNESDDYTHLSHAIDQNQFEIFEYLLSEGADINEGNDKSPLIIAINKKRYQIN